MNDASAAYFRPSGKITAFYMTGFVFFLVIGRFATLSYPKSIYLWGLVLVAALVFFIAKHIERISKVYQIDNLNLSSHTGIFSKSIVRIPLNRITNYQVTQSFIERIMGLGSLIIDTAGGDAAELAMQSMEIRDIELLIRNLDALLAENKLETRSSGAEQGGT